MREETITIEFIRNLKKNGWIIIAYDFPQSGTGKELHPNNSSEKIKGTFKPDIIAFKDGKGLITENKTDYCPYDIKKLIRLKTTDEYSIALSEVFKGYKLETLIVGVVLQDTNKNRLKVLNHKDEIDFSILYNGLNKEFNMVFGEL